LGEDFESEGEEGVAGEDGDAFTVNDVGGGAAASEVIIVHAGEVIVDEGIGMDAFDGGGGVEGEWGGAPGGLGGGEAEDGAEAFSAGEEGIAHGLVEGGGFGGGFGEEAIEGVINFLEMRLDVEVEIHKAGGGVSGGRRGWSSSKIWRRRGWRFGNRRLLFGDLGRSRGDRWG
jgi:hypothetical protein